MLTTDCHDGLCQHAADADMPGHRCTAGCIYKAGILAPIVKGESISGLSWSGFYVAGTKESIRKVHHAIHDADVVVPALRQRIRELVEAQRANN